MSARHRGTIARRARQAMTTKRGRARVLAQTSGAGRPPGLDKHLVDLVVRTAPTTIALTGVGTETAAQLLLTAGANIERLHNEASFAALCAASPIPASSGKTNRHRLNPAGDRDANKALYIIAIVRMRYCPQDEGLRPCNGARPKGLPRKKPSAP